MKTPTPRTRARLVAMAAVPLLLLTGCGDDSSDDDGGSSTAPGAADGADDGAGASPNGNDVPALEGNPCQAEVSLTGALTEEWSGDAVVNKSPDSEVAPPASYQSNHDGYMLTLLSTGNGFDDPSVLLLTDDGSSYAVAFGEGTVQVSEDGSGASVDAPAQKIGTDETAQVKATFSC